jgi:hypothetical protein
VVPPKCRYSVNIICGQWNCLSEVWRNNAFKVFIGRTEGKRLPEKQE